MTHTLPDSLALYQALSRIRFFEETVLENFPRGVFFGTTHTYLGQEANAVGVLSHCLPQDIVFSNHRCHGHFLAYGGSPYALFAELMGKSSGVCGGRGGSQHLQWRNFYSNGIQGGIAPIATGMALAEKLQGHPAVVFVFLGDGTLGEGVLYETLNLASLWNAPVFFILENNRIAQTTPVELAVAGSMAARFNAFGIPTYELDSSDVEEIQTITGNLAGEVRRTQSSRALILHTYRFGPHSKGDDTRLAETISAMRTRRDPLLIHAARLEPLQAAQISSAASAEIAAGFQKALADPLPDLPQEQGLPS